MGFWDWLTGRKKGEVKAEPARPEPPALKFVVSTGGRANDADGPHERWYAPADDLDRFKLNGDGLPPFHFVPYDGAIRLCEDDTGLLIGPRDRRLPRIGIYSHNVVGTNYHAAACRSGDFSPGARVRLVRQPDNEHDPNAVAVKADKPRAGVAGYISKGHARRLAKVLDAGTELEAVAITGTGPGEPCDAITILAADPRVLAHLLTPRPDHLPAPVFQRVT